MKERNKEYEHDELLDQRGQILCSNPLFKKRVVSMNYNGHMTGTSHGRSAFIIV